MRSILNEELLLISGGCDTCSYEGTMDEDACDGSDGCGVSEGDSPDGAKKPLPDVCEQFKQKPKRYVVCKFLEGEGYSTLFERFLQSAQEVMDAIEKRLSEGNLPELPRLPRG